MKIKMTRFKNGWAEGTVGPYRWQAKVYEEGSQFGINRGRISKLAIWDEKKRKESGFLAACTVKYDRGWDIKPKTLKAQQALLTVLKLLEKED